MFFFCFRFFFFFFFNDTAPTEIYPLSLHDPLPICQGWTGGEPICDVRTSLHYFRTTPDRSEEHTPELQSPDHLVCRLLLQKKTRPRFAPRQSPWSRRPRASAVAPVTASS